MKIALSILLGVSFLFNILFVVGGCYLFMQNEKTVVYDGLVLSDEQISILRNREKALHPDICEIIDQYQLFIRNVKGKRLTVLEESK